MTIYNRYGNIIFRTSDPYSGWDGRYKGEPQPKEIYVWVISFANKDVELQKLEGTVSFVTIGNKHSRSQTANILFRIGF